MSRAVVRIGTSGWQYLPFRERFYPPRLAHAELLSHYARHLATVEVNRSHYYFPSTDSFDSWRDSTPESFKFAIKAHRSFTHEHKLGDPENRMTEYLSRLATLGSRMGPLLFQLASNFEADLPRLEAFLQLCDRSRAELGYPEQIRFAFELRHPSWWRVPVWNLLERHGAAFCIHDLRTRRSPLAMTAEFAYVRLHGPHMQPYFGAYSAGELKSWAERIEKWDRETYLYFDNTIEGDAITDALYLKTLFSTRGRRIA